MTLLHTSSIWRAPLNALLLYLGGKLSVPPTKQDLSPLRLPHHYPGEETRHASAAWRFLHIAWQRASVQWKVSKIENAVRSGKFPHLLLHLPLHGLLSSCMMVWQHHYHDHDHPSSSLVIHHRPSSSIIIHHPSSTIHLHPQSNICSQAYLLPERCFFYSKEWWISDKPAQFTKTNSVSGCCFTPLLGVSLHFRHCLPCMARKVCSEGRMVKLEDLPRETVIFVGSKSTAPFWQAQLSPVYHDDHVPILDASTSAASSCGLGCCASRWRSSSTL